MVERYVDDGHPVGSRHARQPARMSTGAPPRCAPSSPALEEPGLPDPSPHTSAGRVPTDTGYRFYVERCWPRGAPPAPRRAHLSALAACGARSTRRFARPPPPCRRSPTWSPLVYRATASHRRRSTGSRSFGSSPRVAMVVVIASNGGRDQTGLHLRRAVDPGLVEWAASYLNERLAALGLGARMAADRARDPELGPTETGVPRRDRAALHRPRRSPPRTPSTSTAPRGCSRGPRRRPARMPTT